MGLTGTPGSCQLQVGHRRNDLATLQLDWPAPAAFTSLELKETITVSSRYYAHCGRAEHGVED
jgi:hypothetical protein